MIKITSGVVVLPPLFIEIKPLFWVL